MIKNRKILSVLLILFLIEGALAQQKEKPLSLEECILQALKNNLNLAVQVLNPELSNISVSRAMEKFYPSLSFGFSTEKTNEASFSWIQSEEQINAESNSYSIQLSQLIPMGGNFSIAFGSNKSESNQKLLSVNPRYSTLLRFNFFQPLLKDFGLKASRREIIVAQNNRDISEKQLKGTLMDTIYNVEKAYWDLTYSIENLKVKRQSLELASELLAKNRREVEVGMMAPIEILSAQAEVASREADIIQAEVLIRNNEDNLKTIINLAAWEKDIEVKIVPADKPSFEKKEISLEEALLLAAENRPDLQATKVDLKNKEIDLSFAKNQLLPDLRLSASYWSPGLSGTQFIYDPRDPFGGPIGSIPGKPSEALKDTFGFRFKNWSAAITLSIPLNTVLSRAQYAQAKVSLEQATLSLKNQEQQVYLEIRNAVRAVQTNYERVQAYRVARELADKKLEAEQKKLKVGLTTDYVVLNYQRDLANAQSAELKAIIDYNLSLADLERATGTSLSNRNIKITE
jgi:outer membrane protein TolC